MSLWVMTSDNGQKSKGFRKERIRSMIGYRVVLVLVLCLLLAGCAGKVTQVEYEYGRPVRVIEIRFLIAPSPAPVDAHPPGRGLVRAEQASGRSKLCLINR